MGGMSEFERYDGLGLAELVRKGEVSVLDLVEECIARIEARNPRINAVISKLYDSARLAAAGAHEGPFAGVPFLLKDLMAPFAGAPMSNGNRVLAKIPCDYDGEIVRRYKKAGLIVVGKTNTPEFGLAPVTEPEAFGPARNPWDLSRTPGGSSGGSAAAVAARIAPMAHATDGGGSIRIPASCCGLVGLKPTRGRTPLGPIVGESWRGFAVGHAVTRSVRDSAALLDATAGADAGAPYEIPAPARPYLSEAATPPGKLRIGYTTAPFLAQTIHADCLEGLNATTSLLKDLGHDVVEATPPFDAEPWLMAFMTIVAGETSADIAQAGKLAGRKLGFADFEAATFVIGLLGRSWSAGDYAAAANYLQSWSRRVGDFFEDYDALLTPTLAAPPTLIGALQPTAAERALLNIIGPLRAGWFMRASGLAKVLATKSLEFIPYTPLFNVTGQPAISLPLCWNAAGLPIGMQFAARMGDEATLVRLAAQLEQAKPWFDRTPAGF
ncbi:amidase [Methylocapsa sp. S129]|uniref:amidase n=1 Tax=Methylocapsa sp. S129 TaxID=1641869 RepID=UPI00131B08B8|nr:amidase [Methylocapsa sp. S129]